MMPFGNGKRGLLHLLQSNCEESGVDKQGGPSTWMKPPLRSGKSGAISLEPVMQMGSVRTQKKAWPGDHE
jgi:hypothetical protein